MKTRIKDGTVRVSAAAADGSNAEEHEHVATLDARAKFVTEVRRYGEAVWAGVDLTEQERVSRLAHAEAALLDIDFTVDHEIEALALDLEAKLDQMIDALQGNWRGAPPHDLPPDLASPDQLMKLRRPVAARERHLLFCGQIEATLYEYRDQGKALLKSWCVDRLNQLRKHAKAFDQVARDLLGHMLAGQAASGPGEALTRAAAGNLALVEELASITTGKNQASLRPFLEANGDQIRNQFNVACAVTCLSIYGTVSVDQLRRLQVLKSVEYLNHRTAEFRQSTQGESDQRRMTRYIDKGLGIVQRVARRRRLPIEPVLVLYKLHPALGRGPLRKRVKPEDNGLGEHKQPDF